MRACITAIAEVNPFPDLPQQHCRAKHEKTSVVPFLRVALSRGTRNFEWLRESGEKDRWVRCRLQKRGTGETNEREGERDRKKGGSSAAVKVKQSIEAGRREKGWERARARAQEANCGATINVLSPGRPSFSRARRPESAARRRRYIFSMENTIIQASSSARLLAPFVPQPPPPPRGI